jgi:eukaryotic-like serine/threonine-protein kinase
MAEYQVAWPFEVLALDDLTDFINRWATWFANSASNQLGNPSSMPERDAAGSWRQD